MPNLNGVALCSIDGHPLLVDELRGTKPTESIDLSALHDAMTMHDAMTIELGVASGMVIASCIAGNEHLKSLK